MYHPATRMLTVLELLQAHPRLSGAALAERLEVDRRTVRRYIAMLEELGIPIQTERGPYGGYSLRPGFTLPPLMLTNDEAVALTLSLVAAQAQDVPASRHALAAVLAKLQRVLPADVRAQVQAVHDVVSFGAPRRSLPHDPLVVALSTAAAERRRVRLHYRSASAETERAFDPYGVVQHGERGYAVGWCHLRAEPRVFRLDRVVALEPLPEHFERPEAFDARAFLLESLVATVSGWDADIVLDARLDVVRARFDPGSARVTEVADGVRLEIATASLDWLARQLLALQCSFVVHAPPELREALRDVAREAAALAERLPAAETGPR
jgi:predicted DNA-binding transcriptional regulator YafY